MYQALHVSRILRFGVRSRLCDRTEQGVKLCRFVDEPIATGSRVKYPRRVRVDFDREKA